MIRMRARELTRRGTILAAAVVFATACSSVTRHGDTSSNRPTLAFENATVDEVAVYIDHAGSRWILGHVEPGRSSLLRIPIAVNMRELSDVRLIAVPLGATRDGLRGIDLTNAICSEFESPKQMLIMRWSLKGHTLVSTVTPSGR